MLRDVHIELEGRELATYRQGTSSSTDTSVFAFTELVRQSDPMESRSGVVQLKIPSEGVMHSFAGDNNKIVWVLKVRGRIDRWPDVKEEFPVTVLPFAVS